MGVSCLNIQGQGKKLFFNTLTIFLNILHVYIEPSSHALFPVLEENKKETRRNINLRNTRKKQEEEILILENNYMIKCCF